MAKSDRLKIHNFAQIAKADITFGDLTVLVGAQGTGKSLALQWLKIAKDGKRVVTALREAGHATKEPQVLIDLIFGVGMGAAWRPNTEISFNDKKIEPKNIGRRGNGMEKAFYIPAHRSMLVADGVPQAEPALPSA